MNTKALTTLHPERIAQLTGSTSLEDMYTLSLLYRYTDQYDEELKIIEKALQIDGSDSYMQKRKHWHGLHYFEKYEPRKTPQLPDDFTPVAQEYRDQLTIIIGGSKEVLYEVMETAESIRNTKYYNNTRIEILDIGFTEEQKHLLYQKFKIDTFHDAFALFEKYLKVDGKNLECAVIHNEWDRNRNCSIMMQMFVSQMVQTKYYIFFDADIWIQSEKGLDDIFRKIINEGVAASHHTFDLVYANDHSNVRCFDIKNLHEKPCGMTGFYGASKDCQALAITQEALSRYASENPATFNENHTEEVLFTYGLYSANPNMEQHLLPKHYFFSLEKCFSDTNTHYRYKPLLDQNNFLIDITGETIVLPHFAGYKHRYYTTPIMKVHADGSIRPVIRSIRYHDLPWRDKEEILQELTLKARGMTC